MTDLLLTGFETDPAGDAYDPDNPTKQTELLALSLRTCLYNLQQESVVISRVVDSSDIDGVDEINTALITLFEDAENFVGSANEAALAENMGDLPALPEVTDLMTVIAPLLPALLSGAIGLPALIPLVAPIAIRLLLRKVITDIVVGHNPGDTAGLTDALNELREALVEEIHTSTETTIEQYNSLCDAIHSLEEYKQVAIMRTAEIDKVIFSEPL